MGVLVRLKAPSFRGTAVMGDDVIREDFSLDDYAGRYVLLFFYPLDFTFVCPSEIRAFDRRIEDFRDRDCDIVGVSVDSHHAHLAWKHTPLDRGGIGPVRFPLVGDIRKEISGKYGVLLPEGVALRATFLIDRKGIVRHQSVNDLDLGRSIDESLRLLDAVRHTEESSLVCPADWRIGEKAVEPTPEGIARYLADLRARR